MTRCRLTASFSHSTYSLDATFTDTSTDADGSVVGWDWDFGDGETSTLQNPVHTYAASNSYTVSLTVTDNDAHTGNTTQSVTVTEDTEAPVITVLGSDPALVDQFELYTDAGATATDNLDGDLTSSISTTGLPVDTNTPGDVTVNYSATDGSGNVGSANRTVTVLANQAPTAGFSSSSALLNVSFTDTSTDSDGSIASWSWDFGDTNTSTTQNPVHTYAGYGTYTVVLTVTDDDGATDDFSAQVTTAPDTTAPVITLIGSNPDSVGQYDTYTDPGYTATDDVDGNVTSSVVVTGWNGVTSTPGTYYLYYNVSDSSNNPATQRTRMVNVAANLDPVAGFSDVINGYSVDFTDTSTDGDGSIAAWAWDFGDSGTSTAQNPTHVYSTYGIYTVTLTVTDDDGATDLFSMDVTLDAPCNASKANMPSGQWVFFSLPCMPSSPTASTVFSTGPQAGNYNSRWLFYTYDSSIPGYVHLGPDDVLERGKGYLFYSLDPFASVSVAGEFNSAGPISLVTDAVNGSWNLVGNPFNGNVDWTSINVSDGIPPIPGPTWTRKRMLRPAQNSLAI